MAGVALMAKKGGWWTRRRRACARSAARVVADVVRGTTVGEGCCVPIARRGKWATAGTLAPTRGDGRDPNRPRRVVPRWWRVAVVQARAG